ncbi:DUF1501 domain-containing protein [Verrucomicrobiales bacterium]|jgi:hypothetical protein|nr:DUF1501 domain-containing protein [Verrucomicrobiales bacterium]MDA9921978.1 DUF1501 domain-containing protein [Verrucomicrobiales bacterium]MDB2642281.1 DUF1501 domain-containing protein [bacterium]MDB3939970.1 DUF1501 domain-containing protein [Verrucomicrobiales bacterium]MDC3353258.1 DUF1501 domain-containing protein [Verrucomicrobiales bacterium]
MNTRRDFLSKSYGMGTIALAALLKEEGLLANPAITGTGSQHYDVTPKPAHGSFGQAKAMISMFMQGGPSHIDMFDPKPELLKLDGKDFPGEVKYDDAAGASREVMGPQWKFSKHGESGMDFSELVPGMASIADDMTMIRSMHTGVNNHGQSINALHNGSILTGRPTLGSWLTYGLGSENRNLPAYVALTDPRGLPVLGVDNFTNGWLPSVYQGTVIRPKEPRILNLDPPASLKGDAQRRYLDFVNGLNREHADARPGETELEARIQSFELAARMQTAAKDAIDISQESEATRKMYGIDQKETQDFGTRCLIARRLVERGVRFVSVFTGNQTWDNHTSILTSLPAACRYVDRPAAALVTDLKQRGLLDSTVVHWGGEMGRLPVIQNRAGAKRGNRAKVGRDHNTYGFSMWMAGGGFKGGYTHGETDEFGHKAVKDVVNHYDYHATLLHLFGLKPEELTFKRNGQEQSLIMNPEAKVVEELLA